MIGYLGGYKFILSLYIYILYHDIPNLIITIGDWVWWSQGYQTSQYRWESRADVWLNWWPWLWGEDLRKTSGCGPTEQVCLCLDCRLLGQIDTFSKSWRWSRDQKARVLLVIFSLAVPASITKNKWTFITDEHSCRFYICHQKSRQGVLASIMQPMLVDWSGDSDAEALKLLEPLKIQWLALSHIRTGYAVITQHQTEVK